MASRPSQYFYDSLLPVSYTHLAEHAAAYPLSLAADALVPLKKVSTIADGIAVGRPGQMPFSIIKELVDDVATVSEDDICLLYTSRCV